MMMILAHCTPPLRGGVQQASIIITWLIVQSSKAANMVRLPPFPNQPPHQNSSYLQSFLVQLLKVLVFCFQPIKTDFLFTQLLSTNHKRLLIYSGAFNQSKTAFALVVVCVAKSTSYLQLAFFQLIFKHVYFYSGFFLGDFFRLLLQQYFCVLQKARLTSKLHFFQLIFNDKFLQNGTIRLGKSSFTVV